MRKWVIPPKRRRAQGRNYSPKNPKGGLFNFTLS